MITHRVTPRLALAGLSLALFAGVGGAQAPGPQPDSKPAPAYSGLGAESVTPEIIARFAPPALEPRISRRIQSMLDVRGAGGGLITSNGARLLFSWLVTGTSQVWRMDGPMRYPIQLTGGEDNTSVAAISPDDQWIVVNRDVGGQENPGLYWMDIEGGPLVDIQHKAKVQTGLAFISDDSRWIYFTANDIDPASYAIYRYEKATKKRDRKSVV